MSQTSSYSTTNEGVQLAACTKCNGRHPFEELSQGKQICKNCRSSRQVIKCNYCRSEFNQEVPASDKSSSSKHNNSICNKCQLLEQQHGKPGPCIYCNIIAAFIGTRCQRCTNSEKKYGPPLACDQCKQKCAFDREDPEGKKKVDNKLLCWLCTMAYKRTLAKAKQKEDAKNHRLDGGDNPASSSSRHHHHHHQHHHHSSSSRHHNTSSTINNGGTSSSSQHHRHSSTHHDSRSSSSRHRDPSSAITSKRQRLDANTIVLQTSSMTTVSSISDNRFSEPNASNDMTALVTQFKEQIALLNKKIQMKEKELLSKDQQIAQLRATITREQREAREKVNNIQKQHAERVSELQAKVVAMQKQMVSQTKAARASTTLVEPPMVI